MSETELYNNLINAEYEYMKFLYNKMFPKFVEETQDHVFDETHWAYKCFFPDKDEDKNKNEDDNNVKLKMLYKKLVLAVHPDKCKESWSQELFIIINTAFENKDIKLLTKINEYYENNNLADFVKTEITFIDKKEQILKWKISCWYLWFYVPSSSIKDILIPKNKYSERLLDMNEKLKKENEELKSFLERLKTLTKKDENLISRVEKQILDYDEKNKKRLDFTT